MTFERIVIASVALSIAATLVHAETLAKAMLWQAFHGASNLGHEVCGLSTTQGAMFFSIKLFGDDNFLTVHMSDKGWRLNEGENYQVTMVFAGQGEWQSIGIALQFPDGDSGLTVRIKSDDSGTFLQAVSDGTQLHIRSQSPNVADLSLTLQGTSTVVSAFLDCLDSMR